jgi:hypothetical protein
MSEENDQINLFYEDEENGEEERFEGFIDEEEIEGDNE